MSKGKSKVTWGVEVSKKVYTYILASPQRINNWQLKKGKKEGHRSRISEVPILLRGSHLAKSEKDREKQVKVKPPEALV